MSTIPITIRAMTATDIPLGMRLKDQAGWNQTAADWRRFLALAPPGGCFVAKWGDRAVGTTVTCEFHEIAWIAMVLVDESARHRGIGTRLVEHAVADLLRRGIRTVRLDATALGRPVYERLGFAAEYELVRLQGTALDAPSGASAVVPARAADVEALATLDQLATGTNRRRLLEMLLADEPDGALIAMVDGRVAGYGFLRTGSRAWQLGPAIADSLPVGTAVLDGLLSRCRGRPIFIDVPLDNGPAIAWAKSRHLTPQRQFTRMYLGQPVRDVLERLWASSGPEKG